MHNNLSNELEKLYIERKLLLEVLVLCGVKFHEVHDSFSLENKDDWETVQSLMSQVGWI